MDRISDAGADGQGTDITQLPRLFRGYTYKVVFAYRDYLHGVGVLEVGGVGMGVRRDNLL